MYADKPNNSKQKIAAGLVALVVIGLLAVGVNTYNSQKDTASATTGAQTTSTDATTSTPQSSNTSSATSSGDSSGTASSFKDGTYTTTSTYYVPHGSESIKVTLTIKDGTITDSSIENSEYDRESAEYQEEFTAEYKSEVIGKSISGLQLSYIAGASDTTQGFDDALDKIRSEAQA